MSSAALTVSRRADADSRSRSFDELREAPELVAERRRIQADLDRPPDKILAFYAEMPLLYGDDAADAAAGYVCPMHPEVTSDEPGTCPKCGMKLIPAAPASYVCPMHPEVTSARTGDLSEVRDEADSRGPQIGPPTATAHEHEHGHDHGDGLEWEDLMPEINRAVDSLEHALEADRPRDRRGEREPSPGTSRWATGSRSGW